MRNIEFLGQQSINIKINNLQAYINISDLENIFDHHYKNTLDPDQKDTYRTLTEEFMMMRKGYINRVLSQQAAKIPIKLNGKNVIAIHIENKQAYMNLEYLEALFQAMIQSTAMINEKITLKNLNKKFTELRKEAIAEHYSKKAIKPN